MKQEQQLKLVTEFKGFFPKGTLISSSDDYDPSADSVYRVSSFTPFCILATKYKTGEKVCMCLDGSFYREVKKENIR